MRTKGVRTGPQKGKTPARLLAYFAENPDEELSPADAAEKLGVTLHTVHVAANRLHQDGVLESVHVIRLPSKGRAS